ncbi:MAG: GerMN domain-containing protein [Actinomycetota bacterium]|nr:GerMN domain-containing protein [Actinomycetota bacterium]
MRLLCLLLASLAFVVTGCTSTLPAADVASEAAVQRADRVDLTLYFRGGRGRQAHLVPVVREVAVSDDLPRTALALMLRGPLTTDEEGLMAPLPTSSKIQAFTVTGDTAAVDLSSDSVDDAAAVDDRPVNEQLALAAIANTLTEFPTIQKVRLTVDGRSAGAFWHAWDLPRTLVRDDSVIGTKPGGEGALDGAGFTTRPQRIGSLPDVAVRATGISSSSRAGYLRIALELEESGELEAGVVPGSMARLRGRDVVLRVHGLITDDITAADLQLADQVLGNIEAAAGPRRVDLVVHAKSRTEFWLHTLTEPPRVVLDVRPR